MSLKEKIQIECPNIQSSVKHLRWSFSAKLVNGSKMYIPQIFHVHSFFYIRTSKFCLRLAVLNFFFIFEAEMFLICSYFPD